MWLVVLLSAHNSGVPHTTDELVCSSRDYLYKCCSSCTKYFESAFRACVRTSLALWVIRRYPSEASSNKIQLTLCLHSCGTSAGSPVECTARGQAVLNVSNPRNHRLESFSQRISLLLLL